MISAFTVCSNKHLNIEELPICEIATIWNIRKILRLCHKKSKWNSILCEQFCSSDNMLRIFLYFFKILLTKVWIRNIFLTQFSSKYKTGWNPQIYAAIIVILFAKEIKKVPKLQCSCDIHWFALQCIYSNE